MTTLGGTPSRRTRRLRADDDTGSTLLLTIFYGVMALVLTLVVVAATSLYVERKRLFTLADGAALAGAESFALDDVAVTEAGIRPRLTSDGVARAAAEFVRDAPSPRFENLRIDRAGTPDGLSATVTLSSRWRPPIVTLFVPDGVRIDVTAVGRSVFR
ncbi:pilus assembly protein TadG-related protein [Marisediminicola sp. LYQ134]|uniref:pilus assembly protein TadG-related protein n=1 Tax=unclassified Marisediminicola TaxID=2618316 RepID=UPI0039831E39